MTSPAFCRLIYDLKRRAVAVVFIIFEDQKELYHSPRGVRLTTELLLSRRLLPFLGLRGNIKNPYCVGMSHESFPCRSLLFSVDFDCASTYYLPRPHPSLKPRVAIDILRRLQARHSKLGKLQLIFRRAVFVWRARKLVDPNRSLVVFVPVWWWCCCCCCCCEESNTNDTVRWPKKIKT